MAALPTPAGSSPATSRRLVAVWFADIVGYSSLASRDETAALQQVQDFQTACREAVDAHGGRIVKFLGDGAFAEFPSTESAVRTALLVSEIFSDRAAASGMDAALRIAVHVGDLILQDDGDLYGDGINTAARLQVQARPGQILVSGDVWRQLKSLPGLEFRRLGKRELRGIDHAIEVFSVVERVGGATAAEEERQVHKPTLTVVGGVYLLLAVLALAVIASLLIAGSAMAIAVASLLLLLAVVLTLAQRRRLRSAAGADGEKPTHVPSARGAELPRPPGSTPRPIPSPAVAQLSGFPAESTPFIGRATEIRKLADLLCDGASRVVTITGVGGMGKTRLAAQAAARSARHFADGAVFVPLAGVTPAAFIPTIGARLGLSLAAASDPAAQVVDFLRPKRMLLVLDNFEQLTDAANQLSPILDEAPGVQLLVTSRERLSLRSETVFPIQGLPLSRGGSGDSGGAVHLFIESARRFLPDFAPSEAEQQTILAICRRVEGIPLAIELAAAWTRVLSCAEIALEVERDFRFLSGEMRDAPERHRGLEAVFESAWRLLTETEREGFRRLAIFRGGFTREEAAAVADVPFSLISLLVDQSLVARQGDGRFGMLEVLRQFAAEKLATVSPEKQGLEERHGSYYAELLLRLYKKVEAGEADAAWEEVELRLQNVRAAWVWAAENERTDLLEAALDGLFGFFNARGRVEEGKELLRVALSRLEGRRDDRNDSSGLLTERVRLRLAILNAYLGSHSAASQAIERTVAFFRANEVVDELALALANLGRVAFWQGDYDEARRYHEESRDLYQRLDDRLGLGKSYIHLGNLSYSSGRFEEAENLYSESLHLLRDSGDAGLLATLLCNLGIIASTRGDYEGAQRLLDQSLKLAKESKNQREAAHTLHTLGATAFAAGANEAAEGYLLEAISIADDLGNRKLNFHCNHHLGKVYLASNRNTEARERLLTALTQAHSLESWAALLEILLTYSRLTAAIDRDLAMETLQMVLHHSAADYGTRSSAENLLKEITGRGESISLYTMDLPSITLDELLEKILHPSPPIPRTEPANENT